jgi:hypothetical protein
MTTSDEMEDGVWPEHGKRQLVEERKGCGVGLRLVVGT